MSEMYWSPTLSADVMGELILVRATECFDDKDTDISVALTIEQAQYLLGRLEKIIGLAMMNRDGVKPQMEKAA